MYSGAFQLLQLQDDISRQFKMDGSGPGNDIESHIRANKDTFLNSLWKLNVVDIELTLINVCQMVSSLCFRSEYCELIEVYPGKLIALSNDTFVIPRQ